MKKIIFSLLAGLFILQNTTFAVTADTQIELKLANESATGFTVEISVQNPSTQQVASVQSWLKYDPSILKGASIDTSTSAFDFVAPGENTFDAAQGIVKIGRSSTSGGSKENSIQVANITFEKIKNTATSISFYNFQMDSSGNVSVRVFEDGFPVNTLKSAPKNLQIGVSSAISTPEPELQASIITPGFALPQVQNLKLTSGPEYALIKWSEVENAQGYNIYFSNKSGRYLQRRSTDSVNEYYLDNLKTGDWYYFSITAYNHKNKESDYSQEVRIRVGYPESSSSPLILTRTQEILKNTKQHVQSGPGMLLIVITVLSAAGVIVRKRLMTV